MLLFISTMLNWEPVFKKLLIQIHRSDVIQFKGSIQVQVRQNYAVRFPVRFSSVQSPEQASCLLPRLSHRTERGEVSGAENKLKDV
jgi:hypothetical protein